MAQKLGNGGHGPENYDTETGQYVESESAGTNYNKVDSKAPSGNSSNGAPTYAKKRGGNSKSKSQTSDLEKMVMATGDEDIIAYYNMLKSFNDPKKEELMKELLDGLNGIKEQSYDLDALPEIESMSDMDIDSELRKLKNWLINDINMDQSVLNNMDSKYQLAALRGFRACYEQYPVEFTSRINFISDRQNDGTIAYWESRNKRLAACRVSYDDMVKTQIRASNDYEKSKGGLEGWWVKCTTNDRRAMQAIIHEYGHAVETMLFKALWNAEDIGYGNEGAYWIQNEIIRRYKEKNPNGVTWDKLCSGYGKASNRKPEEFFAETFSGIFSGQPNALSLCLKEFLDEVFKNRR